MRSHGRYRESFDIKSTETTCVSAPLPPPSHSLSVSLFLSLSFLFHIMYIVMLKIDSMSTHMQGNR